MRCETPIHMPPKIIQTKISNEIQESKDKYVLEDRLSLSVDLAKLVNNPTHSDVTFSLENGTKKAWAHKTILATRSEMFRALLYGGMKESRY